jgi:cob(I)alamin adenosyltransferase
MIANLESHIDKFESDLAPLTNFILPGGNVVAAFFHLGRTTTRRAETILVELSKKEQINQSCQKYLNRLSDLLFVMARLVNKRTNTPDVIWKP